MNNVLKVGGAFLLLLTLSFGVYASDDVDNPWHVSVTAGHYSFDHDRPLSSKAVYGFGIGKFLSPRFSVDLEYDETSGNISSSVMNAAFPGATYDKWNLKATNLVGRLYFSDGTARPYLLAGVGYVDHRNIFDEGGDVGFELGLGLDGEFNDRVSGRLQMIARNERDSDSIKRESSFNDLIFSMGLVFNFGGSKAPPPAAAVVDPDSDGDGVPDSRDRCPGTPKGTAVDTNGCALDSDGDGVLNGKDKCPGTRAGAVVDLDGCEVEEVIALPGVNFAFDSAELTKGSIGILDQAVAILRKHESVHFEVGGHTDSKGKDSYNQGLSERRAQTVMAYLVAQGIKAARMTSVGYGESKPVASNDTEAGRAANRRTELVISNN
jgi:OOP family OmpA-OmpF porin